MSDTSNIAQLQKPPAVPLFATASQSLAVMSVWLPHLCCLATTCCLRASVSLSTCTRAPGANPPVLPVMLCVLLGNFCSGQDYPWFCSGHIFTCQCRPASHPL